MTVSTKEYMGRGVAIPFRTNPDTGDIQVVSEKDNVRACVRMFFLTRLGELDLSEGYGSLSLLFETLNPGTADAAISNIRLGLQKYEPRIFLRSVTPESVAAQKAGYAISQNAVGISLVIRYTIRSTGEDDSYVFTPEE